MGKFHIIAWCCTPLGVAGFVLLGATVSTILGEAFLPQGTFPMQVSWAIENAACISLSILTPLPYLALAVRIKPGSTSLGFRRRLWLIIIGASYGFGFTVALALMTAILLLG